MKKLIITAAFLWTLDANAANWYVSANATGSKNGQNWSNAWQGLSQIAWASINPGDTIWIAGGSYGGVSWGKAGTASGRITLKRATANNPECASAAGWTQALDSQAALSFGDCNGCAGIYMAPPTSDYVTIDGQVPNGIKITLPAPTVNYNAQTTYQVCGIKATGNGNIFQYLEIAGSGLPQCAYGIMAGDNYHYGWKSGLSINHCYIHDVSTSLMIGDIDNMVVEQCELAYTPGNTYNHDNITYIFSGNYGVYRNNYVHDFGAMGLYFCAQYPPGPNHWKVYGNTFFNSANLSGTGQAIDFNPQGSTAFQYGSDWQIYNNTVAGVRVGFRTDNANFPQLSSAITGGSVNNNIFWCSSFDPRNMAHDFNFTDAGSLSGEAHGITGGANPFVALSAGDVHLVSTATSLYPRNHGSALAVEFATDRDGNVRGSDGAWDIGAYECGAGSGGSGNPPSPGSFVITTPASSVNEGTAVNLSVSRVGGSGGAISVNYITSDGTAVAGKNYGAASGTLSWANGDSADKTFSVATIDDGVYASTSLSFTVSLCNPTGGAVLSSPASVTVSAINIDPAQGNPPPASPGTGITLSAASGLIQAPFTVTSGAVGQATQTTDPTQGGQATYQFTNAVAGDYALNALVSAPGDASNSFFINIDSQPADPTAIWDVVSFTNGFESRLVSWRGNGSFDIPQYPVKVWTLSAGIHSIIIRGREANVLIQQISVIKAPQAPTNLRVVSTP